MEMTQEQFNRADHDLLIRVDTKLGTLIGEIQLLRDDTRGRIDALETHKVSVVDFNEHLKADEDHESRIRTMEKFQDTLTGKMWGIGVLVGLIAGILSFVANHYL